jgi:hypothetical protein
MHDSIEEYLARLANPEANALRQSTCDVLASRLATTGAVLWAFGLAEQPRRSIAVAFQMAGETARGAVTLLRENNRYGAAALVRQLVECEYLLYLFATDSEEPLKWASMDLDSVRKEYMPARMRERAGDQFRSSEYRTHCEIGGHPRYAAAYVLPEHIQRPPFSDEVTLAISWVDLGQHMVQIWRHVEQILLASNLHGVGVAASSLQEATRAVDAWLAADACAARLTEAEVAFLSQASGKDEVRH